MSLHLLFTLRMCGAHLPLSLVLCKQRLHVQLSSDWGFRVVTLNSRVIDIRRFGRICRLHQGSSGPVTHHPLGSVNVLGTLLQRKVHARAYLYEQRSGNEFIMQRSQCDWTIGTATLLYYRPCDGNQPIKWSSFLCP